jgi:hypothetical protein
MTWPLNHGSGGGKNGVRPTPLRKASSKGFSVARISGAYAQQAEPGENGQKQRLDHQDVAQVGLDKAE